MEIPFDELWSPEETSDYLTGDYDLVRDINAAILAGKLAAERREYTYTPGTKPPWELAHYAAFGHTPAKTEPKTVYEYLIKPLDAVAWAINAGVSIRTECLDKYHELTKPDKRGPKGGPKDETLYRVIAGLALAHGYKRNSKNAQGWMSTISNESAGLDPKTIKGVIDAALDALDDYKQREI